MPMCLACTNGVANGKPCTACGGSGQIPATRVIRRGPKPGAPQSKVRKRGPKPKGSK